MVSEKETLPDYSSDCLYKVQGTVAEMLGLEIDRPSLSFSDELGEYENVIVLLIDGFGYRYFKENRDIDFFGKLDKVGEDRKISSVYPSETASAMTSFYTGLKPSEHGVIGCYMYFEGSEEMIHSLPFKTLAWEDAANKGLEVENMIKANPCFKLFSENQVDCFAVVPEDIVDGKVSNFLYQGVEQVGYRSLGDMAVKLRKEFEERSDGRNYFFVYIPEVDSMSHHEGTDSEEYRAELSQISHSLGRNFLDILEHAESKDTALLLTADHGFINTGFDERTDLCQFEKLWELLAENSDGEKILPFGGPRNTHLKIEHGKREEARSLLEGELDANIWLKEEVRNQDIFGNEECSQFQDRIGDIIISGHEGAIWHTVESEELEMVGHHGGLSRQEMEIPFLKSDLSDLVK